MDIILAIIWLMIGRGAVEDIQLHQDWMAVQTPVGVWLYEDWADEPHLIPGNVLTMAFREDSVLLVSLCADQKCTQGIIQAWDGDILLEQTDMGDFLAAGLADVDGQLIAISRNQIRVGEQVITTAGIFERFAVNDEWLAVIDSQCEVENTRTILSPGTMIRLMPLDDITQTTCLLFSGYSHHLKFVAMQDHWLAAWSWGGWSSSTVLNLWDLNEPESRIAIGGVGVMAFHPDGERIAISRDDEVQVWQLDDLIAGEGMYESYMVEDYPHTILLHDERIVVTTGGRYGFQVITPDEQYSISGSMPRLGDDGRLVYYQDAAIWDETGHQLGGFWVWTRGAAYLPDGEPIYGACAQPGWEGYCSSSYLMIGDEMVSVVNPVRSLAVSETHIAVADGGVRLFNHAGDEVAVLLEEIYPSEFTWAVWNVDFSTDGQYLAAGTAQGLYLWDMDHLDEPRIVESGWLPDVAFAPEGTLLAMVDREGEIHLMDVATGEITATIQNACCGGDGVTIGQSPFEPGDWILAAGSCRVYEESLIADTVCEESQVMIWSVNQALAAGNLTMDDALITLSGMDSFAVNIAISLDGRYLAVAAYDDGLWVWNLETAEAVQYAYGEVHSVIFSPDGQQIVVDSSQGVIYSGTLP